MSSSGETSAVSTPSRSRTALMRTAGSTSWSVSRTFIRGKPRAGSGMRGSRGRNARRGGPRRRDRRSARARRARRATPPGEPGRLTMRVFLRVPAKPRDSAARGNESSDSRRMRSAMPGASRSSTARVASGVTSRGARPVPPVVSTRSAASPSHHAVSAETIWVVSSGTSCAIGDGVAAGRRPLAASVARGVGALALGAGVGDREDRDAHAKPLPGRSNND